MFSPQSQPAESRVWVVEETEQAVRSVSVTLGVLFVAAASAELLLLANNPHGGEHLKDLLVGQILWVTPASLIPVAALYAVVLALWFGLRDRIGQVGFYILYRGYTVGAAGRDLPCISSLPRSAPAESGKGCAIGYAIGMVGYLLGLIVSSLFDLPTGAVIVCALVTLLIVAVALGELTTLVTGR